MQTPRFGPDQPTVHDEARAARNAGPPILLVHVLETLHVGWRSSEQSPNEFQERNGQHFVLACLYATIIQSTGECIHLMSEPTITLPAVLRSVVEAYADLRAMVKDADHGQRILATFEVAKQRHLKSMIELSGNPYHSGAIAARGAAES